MRAALFLALLCSSCLSASTSSDDTPAEMVAVATSQPAAKAPSADKKKADVDFVALEFAVAAAERRVRAAEMSAALSAIDAESKVHSAEISLKMAEASLAHLDGYTIPTKLAQQDLGIDRSTGRLEESEAELAQILSMYADEEFAEASKELVIQRAQRGVEFSKRSLEMARAERADLEAFELAKDRQEAIEKVRDAGLSLDQARLRKDETMFGSESKLLEAAEGLRKAQLALTKARAKSESDATAEPAAEAEADA